MEISFLLDDGTLIQHKIDTSSTEFGETSRYNSKTKSASRKVLEKGFASIPTENFWKISNARSLAVKIVGSKRSVTYENDEIAAGFTKNLRQFYDSTITNPTTSAVISAQNMSSESTLQTQVKKGEIDIPANSIQYIVKVGDNLELIASEQTRDRTNWETIAEYNGIKNSSSLRVGQAVYIPTSIIVAQKNEAAVSHTPAPSAAIPSKPAITESTFKARIVEDSALLEEAKSKVADELLDPDSARYTNLYVSEFTNSTAGITDRVVCGYVNGKNRFGGYAGRQPFYYQTGSGRSLRPVLPNKRNTLYPLKKIGYDAWVMAYKNVCTITD